MSTTKTDSVNTRKMVEGVLQKLGGKPEGFFKADVKHLYDNKHRVNIWATVDGQCKIVHSEVVLS